MGAHDPCQGVAVGERQGAVAQGMRPLHQFLRLGGAAQEREVAGDLEFRVAARPGSRASPHAAAGEARRGVAPGRAHAKNPCRNQRGGTAGVAGSLAEDPVAPPFLVFGQVVVAGRGVLQPPFALQSLGPPRLRAACACVRPPAEEGRRTRRFRLAGFADDGLHPLRGRQQPERPATSLRPARAVPPERGQRFAEFDRALGQPALARDRTGDASEPEAVPQPVEEGGQLLAAARSVLPPGPSAAARRCCLGPREPVLLLLLDDLDHFGGQHHLLDAETRVDPLQLPREQVHEEPRAAQRSAGTCHQNGTRSIPSVADEPQPPRALACPAQVPAQILQQGFHRSADAVRCRDRLGKGTAGLARKRRRKRDDRLFDEAEDLLQAAARPGTEPLRQRPGVEGIKSPDPVEAEGNQCLHDIGVEPEGGDGKPGQRLLHLGRTRRPGHDGGRLLAVAGQRPGRPGRAGERQPGGEPQPPQPHPQRRQQAPPRHHGDACIPRHRGRARPRRPA